MYKLVWNQTGSKINKYLFRIILTLVFTLLALGLSSVVATILVGQPVSDDYAALNYYSPATWLENASSELLHTGRYGQSLLSSTIYGLFRSSVVIVVPLAVNAGLIVLIYLFLLKSIGKITKALTNTDLFITSLLLYFAVVVVNSSPLVSDVELNFPGFPENGVLFTFENFFWTAGAITYTLPLLLLLTTLFLTFFYFGELTKYKISVFFVVTTMILTTNETLPATVSLVAAILLISSFTPLYSLALKKWRALLLAFLVSGILSFSILVFSPGSTQRQGVTGVRDRLSYSLDSVLSLFGEVNDVFYGYSFSTSNRIADWMLMASIGFIVGVITFRATLITKKATNLAIRNFISFGALAYFAGLMSAYLSFTLVNVGYGTSQVIPRTLIVPQMLITFGKIALIAGLFVFVLSRGSKIISALLSVVALIAVLSCIPNLVGNLQKHVVNASSYSELWSNFESEIMKSGVSENGTLFLIQNGTEVTSELAIANNVGTPVCESWYYEAIAKYYGFGQLCTVTRK